MSEMPVFLAAHNIAYNIRFPNPSHSAMEDGSALHQQRGFVWELHDPGSVCISQYRTRSCGTTSNGTSPRGVYRS